MSDSLTERRKKVLKQAEYARQNNTIMPWEIQQSNQGTDDFPFGGYSEDAQLQNKKTRQGGTYWLNHDMRTGARSEAVRERRKKEWEKQKEEKARENRRKKQEEIADRLLKKGVYKK